MGFIADSLSWIVAKLVAGMKWLVCSMITAFLVWLHTALYSFLSLIPDPWTDWVATYAAPFYEWYLWGDTYVPLSEMLTMILVYYAWCVICAFAQLGLKMMRG